MPERTGWRSPRGILAVGAGAGAFVLWVGPTQVLDYAIRSLPLGCVFALMAVGLVLAYKTSGVLNLAFAAQAFVSAAVFYDLRARNDWEVLPAFVVAVVLVAPALGLVLERFLFRPLRTATPMAKLITSLGLLVAIPEITRIWFGGGASFNPPSIFPDPDRVHRWGDYALDNNQLGTIVLTLVLVAGLSALFRWSSIGLQMRAVVESARLAQLHGVDADRVSALSWALSSFFAGLAGVLLAPLFAQVQAENYFTLLVAALAAATLGGLTRIGVAFAGALALAFAMQVLGGELPVGNPVTANLRPALPFVVLIGLLVFRSASLGRSDTSDPLAGVDPPPPAPAATQRPRGLTIATRVLGATVVVGTLGAAVGGIIDDYWVGRLSLAVALAIAFLSITVISGMGGTVSLCQATFAAIGMFTTAQLVTQQSLDVLTAVALGTVVAAAAGALVALPALRLRGVYLALITLAFAIAFETVLVPQTWVSGGSSILRVPRPTVGPFDFADPTSFFVLLVVLLGVAGAVVLLLRAGTTGRYLDALRASETAATSIGIDPRRTTLVAFTVSAALAGLGGGLIATQTGISGDGPYQANFVSFLGLVWVVLVVTMGARSVQAAITAAVAFVLARELLAGIGIDVRWATVAFGLGALTYARHPEGILEFNTAAIVRLVARRRQEVG